jgi:hypothetical protein
MSDSDDDRRKKRKKEKKEKKEKKSKQKKMKLVETADERKQRRMMKKQKKAQEFFGYTNEANRWGDTNLTTAFVWQKKVDKEVRPPQYLLPPPLLDCVLDAPRPEPEQAVGTPHNAPVHCITTTPHPVRITNRIPSVLPPTPFLHASL